MSHRFRDPFFAAAAARRGYHHGSLKDTLVEAARALIAERGAAGFTLAEAAKLAGVTPAAPYRHFTDRNALLSELARRGFDAFGARLNQAWGGGLPGPVAALWRMGEAYLDFARDEPGYYAAMFGDARVLGDPSALASSLAALGALRAAAAAVLGGAGASDADGRRLGAQIWAVAHGVASLVHSGHFANSAEDSDPKAILGESIAALIDKALRDQIREKVR
ncbi:TetR/AcrR family transcriptional regulator [Methylocapsa sp. S129]|uniref:TetR/AcrR family transcriptional regulator n=1 Tax=Methylocapsa sp. S129 TaxID=1641869 RepID=UPI00131E9C2D|nr:TetR/AcrR family transcriptional regulator [Methylocapsa sp. S129]